MENTQKCLICKQRSINFKSAAIITSYRQDNKDRAVIISNCGEKVLERAKTPADEKDCRNDS